MSITYLSEEKVKSFLSWDSLIPAIEAVLGYYSKKDDSTVQPTRLFMSVPNGILLSMPGYIKEGGLMGCKMVTSFPNNSTKGISSILGNIMLFDSETGQLKILMGGVEITGWRTAAASAVATKWMHKGEKKVLAILGAGTQGKTHSFALQHLFSFQQIRIWNRHPEKAKALRDFLSSHLGKEVVVQYDSNEECVKGADVICTTTYASEPIVQFSWLKPGCHINAVGAGVIHHSELDTETYSNAIVVTDSKEAAEKELSGLYKSGVLMWGEVGEMINGRKFNHEGKFVSVFQSLGMAVEDVITANLVYEQYVANSFLKTEKDQEVLIEKTSDLEH